MYTKEYDINTTRIPLSFTFTKNSELQLQDVTRGDSVSPQEWIARELGRIRGDVRPRHCPAYEQLLEVIDIVSRHLEQGNVQYQQQVYDTTERDRLVAKQLLLLQQKQSDHEDKLKFDDLVNAFVDVVQYSERHVLINACTSEPHPVKLVRVLEDIRNRRDQDGGRIGDREWAQRQLFLILFGKVQMTSQLVQTWKVICEWAKQLVYTGDWHGWMEFGLDAFIKAKHRRVTIEPLAQSTSSSSSSSASSNHHGGQIMMEQLRTLLQNTHLVEKSPRA
ncbi:hypothetical protein BJV82DRAFT_69138 [Fennellomyces sp. T-0311]|nr:hypothetical protein BJV82DRAFT_69138 [Fennellomyces sp. T-0311]